MHTDRNGVLRGGPHDRPLAEMTREDLLWDFRTFEEEVHQSNIWHKTIRHPYQPSARDVNANHPLNMSVDDFYETCNKSVPVYVPYCPNQRLLHIVLHNYIYRRWFRPYRSEVDFDRFICKMIFPRELPSEASVSQLTARSLIGLNRAICSKFESLRSLYAEHRALDKKWLPDGIRIPDERLYILQPLFRALIVLISGEHYNNETSIAVGGLPVYLIRTGVEEGLSAPITFKPIEAKISRHIEPECVVQVTLETAVDFVLNLEARETAAFGLRPDPVAEWKLNEQDVKYWRQVGETGPLVGPSSQWVDADKYPQKPKGGEPLFFDPMPLRERQQFIQEARRVDEEAGRITSASQLGLHFPSSELENTF